MEVNFDVISDLYLSPDDIFNWENKATSLYCIVAGNISSDLETIRKTLAHLSEFYQGVFYIMGYLEYENQENIDYRTIELLDIASQLPNVAILFHNVVIIDGIAILGCNGWNISDSGQAIDFDPKIRSSRINDLGYVCNSVAKLQKHLDVKRILIVSSAVPMKSLYFGEHPKFYDSCTPLSYCIKSDTEMKISKWIFGSYRKVVDIVFDDIHYINNPLLKDRPYWPKRISMRV